MNAEPLSVIKGTLELLVLKSLAKQQEAHGFEILEWIESTTAQALAIEEGALYPALHRMEKRGLLDSVWGVSDKGPRRSPGRGGAAVRLGRRTPGRTPH